MVQFFRRSGREDLRNMAVDFRGRKNRQNLKELKRLEGRPTRMQKRCAHRYGAMRTAIALTAGVCVACGCGWAQNPKPAQAGPAKAAVAPAQFENYTETVPGTKLKFEMIAVPGGTFLMGSPESEAGRKKDEGPQHRVTVSPFWIGKIEVTWEEYEAFMDACPGLPKGTSETEEDIDGITGPTPPYGDPYRGFSGGSRPVVGISWHAAMTYCLWLSKKTGELYRLPTEAEWEYACRAGSDGSFCCGDDESKLEEYAWYKGKSKHETHPTGSKKPNAWGICDMHGNAAEWCLDWYQADDYSSFPLDGWPADPRGPREGKNHVIRGGHFDTAASGIRCASRDQSKDWWLNLDPQEPKSKWWHVPTNFLGFRVVRPVKEEKPPARESRRGL
jgi:sulfatase modifying factor 1